MYYPSGLYRLVHMWAYGFNTTYDTCNTIWIYFHIVKRTEPITYDTCNTIWISFHIMKLLLHKTCIWDKLEVLCTHICPPIVGKALSLASPNPHIHHSSNKLFGWACLIMVMDGWVRSPHTSHESLLRWVCHVCIAPYCVVGKPLALVL